MPPEDRLPPTAPERPSAKRPASPYPRGRVIQPDDDPRTVEALLWLLRSRIRFIRKTRHHIKINAINFFPTTGKIAIDGAGPALPQRGLAALQALLLPATAGEASTEASTEAADLGQGASEMGLPSAAIDPTSTVPLLEGGVVQVAGADAPSQCDPRMAVDIPPWAD